MKVLDIIKWLNGYVQVEVFYENASAFLSFLAYQGVTVSKVIKNNDSILFEMSLADYKNIRAYKRKFGRKIMIKHKALYGFPKKMNIINQRKSLAVGAVLFVALLIFLSQFIWKIEIVGNETIQKSEIIEAYTELGVNEGMFKRDFDSYKIRDKFTLLFSKASWCSFNLEGCVLTVNISEAKESDKSGKFSHSNLVAECDGIIKKIDVVSGYTAVKVGYVVSKGEVLVSGVSESGNSFTWSKGKVLAETEQTFTMRIPKQYEKTTVLDGLEKRRVLQIFGVEIPLYLDSVHFESNSASEVLNVKIFGERLPISLITREFTEVEKQTVNKSEKECENDSVALLLEICKERKAENITILEKYVKEEKDFFVYTYKCRLIEDIAEIQRINVTS